MNNLDREECAELLDLLDGLPLAIAQAGSFIGLNGSILRYIQFYKETWAELIDSHVPLGYRNGSILITWTVSYKAIKRMDEAAANMLQLWAYLDNRDLWWDLLNQTADSDLCTRQNTPDWFKETVWTKVGFEKAMNTLHAYSLIEVKVGHESYAMHPVLHDWCQKFLNKHNSDEFVWLAITSVWFGARSDKHQEDFALQWRLLPHGDRCC
jgi:hypothetical protein